jgi:hypothetical protein
VEARVVADGQCRPPQGPLEELLEVEVAHVHHGAQLAIADTEALHTETGPRSYSDANAKDGKIGREGPVGKNGNRALSLESGNGKEGSLGRRLTRLIDPQGLIREKGVMR